MEIKDWAQLGAPFVAAFTALWIASLQRRERISAVITETFDRNEGAWPNLVIHNRGSQSLAIIDVRYVEGILWRAPVPQSTALGYDDPEDYDFPYIVEPDKLRYLMLDRPQATRLAAEVIGFRWWLARVLRRSRLMVQFRTASGRRVRIPAELAVEYRERAPWAQR